ncbi:MAG: pseudaminic acid cytidylyltransferase [Lachnospiraceae bacterium]|nr:pseudaminic acid cytidylyltransferase [Lachnospiraceae bacterium]
MSSIAIITARGQSKRIPRKNIHPFAGRPLIAYSIEAAIGSGVFDTILVSTDDEEIAEIAKGLGASVPFLRSAGNSDDHATTNDVLTEVLNTLKAKGEAYETACCIYPTAPFLTGQKLREAYGAFLKEEDADTMISVVRFSYPPQRAYRKSGSAIEFVHPEYALTRSQDLEPLYHDAGQFYLFRTDSFLERRSLFGGRILPFELPESEVQDIDTPEDLKIAEMKYRILRSL